MSFALFFSEKIFEIYNYSFFSFFKKKKKNHNTEGEIYKDNRESL